MSKKKEIVQPELKGELQNIFSEQKDLFSNGDPRINRLRDDAMDFFSTEGFPSQKLEAWRSTNIIDDLKKDFKILLKPEFSDVDTGKLFQCEVPDFDTDLYKQLNGFYLNQDQPLTKYDNGVVIGSLSAAAQEYPEIFERHYGRYADIQKSGLVALNTAMTRDGIFIYIPDNVELDRTIQMVNVTQHNDYAFVQYRNLVVMGKNSKLRLVQCDDSTNHQLSFTNVVTETYLDEGASLDHYKLQNLNDSSTLVSTAFFDVSENAGLSTNAITLNGGKIRNEAHVRLNGRNSHADVLGLYLVDKEQHVDNEVFMDHAVADCTSNQLFKGIADDHARAVFNGQILVRKDAQRTLAYQNSKNIALTDKATINAKPFLEIYADDVKCSHGATVGQLDDEALFYIKSRGINEDDARLLLMYAFAAEVIEHIQLQPLKERMDDLVKKRLRGELSVCDQCVLHCSHPEKSYTFEIDMDKI